jgi:hypothetical protein
VLSAASTAGAKPRAVRRSVNTRRVISLIKKLPTFRTLATHPITVAACEASLKPACSSYQVHATAAFVVEPGAGVQVLHREDDPFHFLPSPRPNLVTASTVGDVGLHRGQRSRSESARSGMTSLGDDVVGRDGRSR